MLFVGSISQQNPVNIPGRDTNTHMSQGCVVIPVSLVLCHDGWCIPARVLQAKEPGSRPSHPGGERTLVWKMT